MNYAINKQVWSNQSHLPLVQLRGAAAVAWGLQKHLSLPTWHCPWSAALWGGQLSHHSDKETKKDKVLRRIPNTFKHKPLQTWRGASKGAQSLEENSRLNSPTETGGNVKVFWVKIWKSTKIYLILMENFHNQQSQHWHCWEPNTWQTSTQW